MLEKYTIDGFEQIQYQDFYALEAIAKKLSYLYKQYGYHSVPIPAFEAYDLYVSEKAIPNDDLFKLVNHQGKVLVLRPDATLPIARMAALNYKDQEAILKFYYQTNIYRNFSTDSMTKKEMTQMGIEYFGNSTPECDGEVIALAIKSLLDNGIKDIHIDLGHVGFINSLMNELKLDITTQSHVQSLIENKNITDLENYLKQLDISSAQGECLLMLPKLYGHPRVVLEKLRKLCINQQTETVIDQLKAIYKHLDMIGMSDYISFDLGFTNQMNYYSDIIFKGYVNNWGEAILSGGRYNQLSEKFGIIRPACGFGIDLIKMLEYMEAAEIVSAEPEEHVIVIYAPEKKTEAHKVVSMLRAQGKIAEMFIQKVQRSEETVYSFQKNMFYTHARYYYINCKGTYCFNGKNFCLSDIFEKEGIPK